MKKLYKGKRTVQSYSCKYQYRIAHSLLNRLPYELQIMIQIEAGREIHKVRQSFVNLAIRAYRGMAESRWRCQLVYDDRYSESIPRYPHKIDSLYYGRLKMLRGFIRVRDYTYGYKRPDGVLSHFPTFKKQKASIRYYR